MSEKPLQQDETEAQDESQSQVPGTASPSQAPVEDDRLLRLAADFENYKKRAAREREEYVTLANERLIAELIPILDDLERALNAAEEHQEAQLEEGVRLVHRSLASLLERHGVTPIETDGKFDPHVHEALLSQPSEAEERLGARRGTEGLQARRPRRAAGAGRHRWAAAGGTGHRCLSPSTTRSA